MRAAIYARRSTDEHQAASLEVQIGEARRFIAARGWSLEEDHVHVDDAVSRAEFKRRPGLIALLNAAAARAFDVVVVRDDSRLGGDMHRTGLIIQDLIEAGVRLFYYYADEEVTLDGGAVDKFMIAVRSFASELEREKTAQRTHEHLLTKARRGLNVGGRVYGYDNLEVREGDRRVRVEYRVNEEQAQVVRDIFAWFAAGAGVRAIAKRLNEARVPSPRAGKRGTGSWAPSLVWGMLRRERYCGVLVWGRKGKTYRGGTRVTISHPECDWVRIELPELRVVSAELWQAAQGQMRQTRAIAGKSSTVGRKPTHLLSALAKCGHCGGPMQATNHRLGRSVVKVYVCGWHRSRGSSVCASSAKRPVAVVNEAVATWINERVLSEGVVRAAIGLLREVNADNGRRRDAEAPELQAEVRQLRGEIDNLTLALAGAAEKPSAVIVAIAEREVRQRSLQARLDAMKAAPAELDLALVRLEREALARVGQLQGMIERNVEEGRRLVQSLLVGALTMMPTKDGKFEVTGQTTIGPLLLSLMLAAPTGFEHWGERLVQELRVVA